MTGLINALLTITIGLAAMLALLAVATGTARRYTRRLDR